MLELTVLEARHILHVLRELQDPEIDAYCGEVDEAIEIIESLLERNDKCDIS